MSQSHRLLEGGRVDRGAPINFTFNNETYQGYRGDTLASALLANGVHLVARSFKYHRPRGIVASGSEEPNALVQLGEGPYSVPNVQATQIALHNGLVASSVNCWPSVNFDVRAATGLISRFLPPGFYYKTFMWPRKLWPMYEHQLRKAGGYGVSPDEPDPDRYDKHNAHCDVLVVGGGPAGLAAALEAGRSGARVILADEQNEFGGSLLGTTDMIDNAPAMKWVASALKELAGMDEVRLLPRSTVAGYFDHNFLTILERVADHLDSASAISPRQRLWRVRAGQVILATGAIERPLVFGNNDRPGVMLASAVSTYLNRYAVKPGKRSVVFTNNDAGYQTALDLAGVGGDVAAVVDVRAEPKGELPQRVKKMGIEVLAGHAVVDVRGGRHVRGVDIMRLNGDGVADGSLKKIKCDLLAVSGGWSPVVHLHSQSGGRPRFDEAKACFLPGPPVQAERSAGSCNGTFSLGECLVEGFTVGAEAALAAGFGDGKPASTIPVTGNVAEEPLHAMWEIPARSDGGGSHKRFVDFQADVTTDDILIAAREGYESVEHLKRYTTAGMGTDQGKLGNINVIGILAHTIGTDLMSVGTTTFRPPYTPVTYGAIAGRDLGDMFDPVRKTALHEWHEDAGALFENVGQWKRPWYYPRPGESMHEAVERECLVVRSAVGIVDASTLGKIDIKGPDSGKFLNRLYINGFAKLAIGRCRYGFMLDENGMVMDDGVTARLGKNHYLMHTTTSGAANVMAWMERWLQTEWPDLKVYLTSVTDHWATVSLNGPRSRNVLARLCSDVDLSNDEFQFLSVRTGTVAGVPARIFRVSFGGELSYEINVNANYGRAVWEAAMDAGQGVGIAPYGTEAMHLLRAEKGYVIVGQDSDGSMTPADLGFAGMVSGRKDFLGKRSLSREHTARTDRKQLVGLLTEDPSTVLPEGGQIVEEDATGVPMPMLGHVTSSYRSAKLGRSIALAMLKDGHRRTGDAVYVPLADGRRVKAHVTDTVFYDPKGERQNV